MTCHPRIITLAVLGVFALAGSAAAQTRAPVGTEQRDAGMKKLREQTDAMYDQQLDPGKKEFRDQMQLLMDTVATLDAAGNRTARAYTAGNLAVLTSQGRMLRASCQAAARVVAAATPRFQVLTTSTLLGERVLSGYRTELLAMGKVAATCDRTADEALKQGSEGAKRLGQLAETVGKAVVKHDQAATDLLRALQIELRPRGYTPSAGR